MNREEFMAQLERLLWDISENDRLDAIAYYNDYFDEAGIENEGKVIQELGSPGKVAAIIKADLGMTGNERAEYTENGYSDGRSDGTQNPPSRRETGYHEPKPKRSVPLILLIILLVFASPVLIGLGGGLLGGLFGLLGGLFGIIIAAVVGCVTCIIGGIVGLVVGIVKLIFNPIHGLLYMGLGSIALAIGIFLLILFVWAAFKWVPALFRGCVNLIQRLFHRKERGSQV